MKKAIGYLLQGLLYIAPIGLTVYIIYALFEFTDNLLQEWIIEYLKVKIPGLGVFIIIAFLIFLGFIGQTIIALPFKRVFHKILNKAPLLKVIYSAINELLSAFVGKEKKFNKPVLVKVNMTSNLEKIGFLTEDDLLFLGEKDKVAVYFPHSYNFSGEMFIVSKEQIRVLDLPPAEVMKFVVSAGVAGMDNIDNNKK